MSDDWLASWRQDFSDALPVGYLLRAAVPNRWLRTHSLPESKRYPESEAEMQEVLRRYAMVAADVLGTGPCILTSVTYDDQPGGGLSHADEGGLWLNVTAEPVRWSREAFENRLRAVANDESGPILFYAIVQGRAFAPYDGGADLFFESEAVRDLYRARYADWLSSHPEGL